MSLLFPTILCGGSGSRLWPVSREYYPKPFIRLHDGTSLLQQTVLRAANLPNTETILIVTNEALFFSAQDEIEALNLSQKKIIYFLESHPKNTGPAILEAALYLEKNYGHDACMLVLPADHLISKRDNFENSVKLASRVAKEACLVTLGITPTYPETGYGYIHRDPKPLFTDTPKNISAYRAHAFVEKPSLEIAETYLKRQDYLWNAGIFCFHAKTILKHIEKHCPTLFHVFSKPFKTTKVHHATIIRFPESSFLESPNLSIDYAVMEKAAKAGNVSVIPCDIGWNDIGSFDALARLSQTDQKGNVSKGKTLLYDTKDCYIDSPSRLTSCLGLQNLIIVDTQDALLVAEKTRAQEVKKIYETLKESGNETYQFHCTVHRPWGHYTVLASAPNFKIKSIEVKPGAQLSLQLHHHRSEHWIIISGTAHVTRDDEIFIIHENESTFIPKECKHRLENKQKIPLVIIEVQSGTYLGEDDIVRFEDQYGRIEKMHY